MISLVTVLIGLASCFGGEKNVTILNDYRLRHSPRAEVRKSGSTKTAFVWELITRILGDNQGEALVSIEKLSKFPTRALPGDRDLSFALVEFSRSVSATPAGDNLRAKIKDLLRRMPITNPKTRAKVELELAAIDADQRNLHLRARLKAKQKKSLPIDEADAAMAAQNSIDELLSYFERPGTPLQIALDAMHSDAFTMANARVLFLDDLRQPVQTSAGINRLAALAECWRLIHATSDVNLVREYIDILGQAAPKEGLFTAINLHELHQSILDLLRNADPTEASFEAVLFSPDSLWQRLGSMVDQRAQILTAMARTRKVAVHAVELLGQLTQLTPNQAAALWTAIGAVDREFEYALPMAGFAAALFDDVLIFAPELAAEMYPNARGSAAELNRWLQKQKQFRPHLVDTKYLDFIRAASPFPTDPSDVAELVTQLRAARRLNILDDRLQKVALRALNLNTEDELMTAVDAALVREAVSYLNLDASVWVKQIRAGRLLDESLPNQDARFRVALSAAAFSREIRISLLRFLGVPRYAKRTFRSLMAIPDELVHEKLERFVTENPGVDSVLAPAGTTPECVDDLTSF